MINSLADTGNIDATIPTNVNDFPESSLLLFRPVEFISLFWQERLFIKLKNAPGVYVFVPG